MSAPREPCERSTACIRPEPEEYELLFYASVLLIPALAALMLRGRPSLPALLLFSVFLVVAVGLRHKVGMDWNNYLVLHQKISYATLEEAARTSEIGYNLVAWSSVRLGYDLYGTNFVAAVLFTLGLISFARTTLNPWMAVVAAAPYLITVIAMSAVRQAAAVGLLLFAFGRWRESGTVTRVLIILAAAAFHLSALFCLAFVFLETRISTFKRVLLLGLLTGVMAIVIPASDHFTYYSEVYLDRAGEFESTGALAHVALIAGPGALYLLLRRKWQRRFGNDPLIDGMAIMSLLAVPAVLVFSTVVDRMSLYLYGLPMMVYANLPYVLARGTSAKVLQFLIIGAHLAVLLIWLRLSNSASAYLPYSNLLFQ